MPARPAGCWTPSQEKLAIEQTSGRQRINIHGAIDLETGQTQMIEALTIDARRPTRKRDCLVRERTRIVNRMKSALVRLGVRGQPETPQGH